MNVQTGERHWIVSDAVQFPNWAKDALLNPNNNVIVKNVCLIVYHCLI